MLIANNNCSLGTIKYCPFNFTATLSESITWTKVNKFDNYRVEKH